MTQTRENLTIQTTITYPVENPPVPAPSFFCISSGLIGVVSSRDGGGAIAAPPRLSGIWFESQNKGICNFIQIFFCCNPFHFTGLFLCPLKTLENLWFSDVCRGHKKKPVAWNGWNFVLQYFAIHYLRSNYRKTFRCMTENNDCKFWTFEMFFVRYNSWLNHSRTKYPPSNPFCCKIGTKLVHKLLPVSKCQLNVYN